MLRSALSAAGLCLALCIAGPIGARAETDVTIPAFAPDASTRASWLETWQHHILAEARARYCDTEMGEEIGWLVSPMLEGFYYGHLATGDPRWLDLLTDWTDAWIRRAVIEPDGYRGWPKLGAAGTDVDHLSSYVTDSLLGEAMVLRPVVLAAAEIVRDPELDRRYGQQARSYLRLAREMFEKWDRRGVWREAGSGMISVVLPYGIDPDGGQWTENEKDKNDLRIGFSHPDNKANLVAMWLLAMNDATGEPAYKDRAAAWFRIMKARLRPDAQEGYQIWSYWQPAGPWDYNSWGAPKHWIGVHPNRGYYETDVRAIAEAYRHGVVFTAADIERLIRTGIDTGRFWYALAPYDQTIRTRFERRLKPDSWEGLSLVPWYLAQQPAHR